MEQFVLFRLGDETYGLPIAAVVEVVRLPNAVTRVPRAPAFLAGVMNHRGAVVPLIDQSRRFTLPRGTDERQRRVIITRLDDLERRSGHVRQRPPRDRELLPRESGGVRSERRGSQRCRPRC